MKLKYFTAFLFPLIQIAAHGQSAGIFEATSDIGINPKPGSVTFDRSTSEYSITGNGANVWGTQDAFRYVYSRISGDFTLSADVRFIGQGVDPHRKAMLMVRQELTPGSVYADVALHGDGMVSLQYRSAADGPTREQRSSLKAPTRIRIERRGNNFTLFAGAAGESLTPTGPQQVEFSGPVYVGLGMCAHNADVLETAVFSNVRLEPANPVTRYRSKITVLDVATRTAKTLYEGDGVIEAPNWSRDGKFLLVNTGGGLYKLALEGSGNSKLERIGLDASYRCNNDHDLSSDGKLLAFSASSPQSRQSQVYVSNADGSSPKLLTPAAPSYFHGWSPDRKWLAFVGQRERKYELFRVSVDGGAEQRLTSKGAYDDGPEYTPDGKWIYFNSDRSGAWDIWRMPADGAGPGDAKAEQVTNDDGEDWFPHFSPNGKQLVFLSFPKGTKGHNDRMPGVTLRWMRAPGKKLKPARIETLVTIFGGQGTINVNSWSPDSKKIAYVVYETVPPVAASSQ